jgi:hypothetical protein
MQIIKETPTELYIKVKPTFTQIILLSIGISVGLPYAVGLSYWMSKDEMFSMNYILRLDTFASIMLIGLTIMLVGSILFIAFFSFFTLDYIFRVTYLNINKCESKISSRSISLFGLRKYFFDI